MSVQSQIDRISANVASTYSVLEEAGGSMPSARNSNNLPSTTAATLGAKLDKTTYEYNKELVIGSSGKVCIGKFPM